MPEYQNQLVTSSKKIAIKRPIISVCIRCICRELAAASFSSKLNFRYGMENRTAKFEQRPWGSFTVLDEGENYKVKRIEVSPGRRLSYQRHTRRAEHWYVVRGIAKVTLNGVEILLKKGEGVDIGTGDSHRVENPSTDERLVFVEVQTGDYFGEDDIERLDDDFGRI